MSENSEKAQSFATIMHCPLLGLPYINSIIHKPLAVLPSRTY